jgi:hypothetical protein
MEKRVKLFFENDTIELEEAINDFLQSTPGKMQDVRYQYLCIDDYWHLSAMVIYLPDEVYEEKNENTKENEKSDGGIQRRITPLWEQTRPRC